MKFRLRYALINSGHYSIRRWLEDSCPGVEDPGKSDREGARAAAATTYVM